MITRDEHLAWAKERALAYLERWDPQQAFTSMMSDLGKHDELKDHVGIRIGVGYMMLPGWINDIEKVRRWIVGFN